MAEVIAILEPYCYFQSGKADVVFINELDEEILFYDCDVRPYIFGNSNTAFCFEKENCGNIFFGMICELEAKKYLSVYPENSFSKSVFFDRLPLHLDPDPRDLALFKNDFDSESNRFIKAISIYPDATEIMNDLVDAWKQFFAPVNTPQGQELDVTLLPAFIQYLPFSSKSFFYVCTNNVEIAVNTVAQLQRLGISASKIIVRSFFSDSYVAMLTCLQGRARLEFLVRSTMYHSCSDVLDSAMIRLLVKDMSDYDCISDNKKLINFKWLPIINNDESRNFFLDRFMLSTEIIHKQKHTLKSLKLKNELNTNLFGVMHIMPDGTVWDSPNGHCMGSIYTDKPVRVLRRCMETNSAWMQTRIKVSICNSCAYCNMCPSISEYERYCGSYAICSKSICIENLE